MTRRSIWFSIRGSLWFVPLLLFLLSAVAAFGLVHLDRHLDLEMSDHLPDPLFTGPEGAREILSTIASSIITVAGVIFSITVVTLSLAAAQYSPRVLRSFMRDRLNQVVLGVLVAVFTYSLLVLRAVRTEDDASFVPQIALWFAIVLVLVALGFMIAFIHNTAVSIQAPEIVSRITGETLTALEAVSRSSHEDEAAQISEELPDKEEMAKLEWQVVPSRHSGYVQDVDISKLFEIACQQDCILRVECPVGDFATAGRPLVAVSCGREIDAKTAASIQRQLGINSYRTIDQDPAFGIRQLVDIALKALSPSLNDTTTAIHCVDQLGVILQSAARAPNLAQTHRQSGKLRLILQRPTTSHMIDLACNEIRQAARGNVAILLRLFRMLRQLREATDDPPLRYQLRKHVNLISENIERYVDAPADRRVLHTAAAAARDAVLVRREM